MIPLLLLTLTLVAILAYLMGYHDGHRRGIDHALQDITDYDMYEQECAVATENELRALKIAYAQLLADHKYLIEHKYLIWMRNDTTQAPTEPSFDCY